MASTDEDLHELRLAASLFRLPGVSRWGFYFGHVTLKSIVSIAFQRSRGRPDASAATLNYEPTCAPVQTRSCPARIVPCSGISQSQVEGRQQHRAFMLRSLACTIVSRVGSDSADDISHQSLVRGRELEVPNKKNQLPAWMLASFETAQ